MVDSGRIRDTLLLDELIQIAQGKEPRPRGLDEVAADWIQAAVDKDSVYRDRFGELLELPNWKAADPGFFEYAAKDARVTFSVYVAMVAQAKQIIQPFREQLLPRAQQRFGYLTETIQIKASIALDAIRRNGMAISQEQVGMTRERLQTEIGDLTEDLEQQHPGAVKRRKRSGVPYVTDSGVPCLHDGELVQRFAEIVRGKGVAVPLTDTDRLTSSPKYWATQQAHHQLIDTWVRFKDAGKLSSFFQGLKSDRIHPKYQVLVRTGRTSCSNPNVQQLPKAAGFREMVVASPGYYLFAIDYCAIELATLGAVCEHRFGHSQLADIIRNGSDPHCYTAALLLDMPLDEFMQLKETEPEKFKRWRQAAKAVAFGVPGGLGAGTLKDYAQSTYGVELTLEEAKAFRHRLIHHVYPELKHYLRDDGAEAVCTLTGRVRGNVTFCQARNAPFQGLASDGIKQAIWKLLLAGYRIVGMVHDEVLIELPQDADHTADAARINSIMCEAMQELTGRVPVSCEYTLSTCWSKQAEMIADERGRLLVWTPKRQSVLQPEPVSSGRNEVVSPPPPLTTKTQPDTISPEVARTSSIDAKGKSKTRTRKRQESDGGGGKLTQPLKWFGGKHYLAPKIIDLMPPHVHYVEPFFGGGSVLLQKPYEGISEVINDRYGRLSNFWKVIADPAQFEQFYRQVEALPFSQQLWEESQQPADDPVEAAVCFFVFARQSRAGQLKDFATLSRNRTRRAMNEQASAWMTAVAGLPQVHVRLKRVVVLCDDAVNVIRQQDGPNTLFYCDPPYLHETRTSTNEYAHEMTETDHRQLLEVLNQCKGKVLLSGYPSKLYDKLLHDWNRQDFEIDNKASGSITKRKMTECLWMNY